MSHCAGQRRAPAPAHTYCVDATLGSDTATGHEDAPLQTIAAVNVLALKPGDRVLFKRVEVWSGDTLEPVANGKAGRPIVFADYGSGALPIIRYDNGYCFTLASPCHVRIMNLDLDVVSEPATEKDGLFITGSNVHDILVSGCVARNAYIGFSLWTDVIGAYRIVWAGNISHDNKTQGIFTGASDGTPNHTEVMLDGNTCYSNGSSNASDHGIYLNNNIGAILRHNVCYSNASSGIKDKNSPGTLGYGNRLYLNYNGLVIAGTQAGARWQNNLLYLNTTANLQFLDVSTDGYILNNTLVNAGQSEIECYDTGDQISGYTFKNNIFLHDFAAQGGQGVGMRFKTVGPIAANTWNNNDWVMLSGANANIGVETTSWGDWTFAEWQAGASSPDAQGIGTNPVFATVTTYSTTVDADSASGQKVLNVAATGDFAAGQSVVINDGGARQEVKVIGSIQAGVSLTMTVNLVSTHTGAQADVVARRVYTDYHLQVSSPCIAAGDATAGVLQDYDGVTRGVANDIGALEYVA